MPNELSALIVFCSTIGIALPAILIGLSILASEHWENFNKEFDYGERRLITGGMLFGAGTAWLFGFFVHLSIYNWIVQSQ